ncbi:hypothetical protein Q8A73_007203 [Channa argus]|nr:hypothetical protein Q8A73_007203 [Channa argus]
MTRLKEAGREDGRSGVFPSFFLSISSSSSFLQSILSLAPPAPFLLLNASHVFASSLYSSWVHLKYLLQFDSHKFTCEVQLIISPPHHPDEGRETKKPQVDAQRRTVKECVCKGLM